MESPLCAKNWEVWLIQFCVPEHSPPPNPKPNPGALKDNLIHVVPQAGSKFMTSQKLEFADLFF